MEQSLTAWGLIALEHWKKHRPMMCRKLEAAGLLEQAAIQHQEKATEAALDLYYQGTPLEAAKEIVMAQLIYLPSEEEVPILPPDQMPFLLSQK